MIFIICCGTLEDILGERKNKIYQKLSTLTLMKKAPSSISSFKAEGSGGDRHFVHPGQIAPDSERCPK